MISPISECLKFLQREARGLTPRNIDPMTETDLTKIPLARQLRPRISETAVNVAYYNLFLTGSVTTEYEDGNIKILSSYRRGVTEHRSGGPFFEVLVVDTSASAPIRMMHQTIPVRFLRTAAFKDFDGWAHQDLAELVGWSQIRFKVQDLILDKFNTFCLVINLTEETRLLSYPSLVDAFTKGYYVYLTTETGTTKLASIEALDVPMIWGTEQVHAKRYISISKSDLLPE